MAQYVHSQLGQCSEAGDTIAITILRFFGRRNYKTLREGGMIRAVGDIPVFNDEQLKVPNVITPYMMPAAFLTVVNELGWITNYNQAFTNTMSSVEQLANRRFGCVGSSRSSYYESDGGRLLSRDETLTPPVFVSYISQFRCV